MATVPRCLGWSDDILTQASLSRCLFGLTSALSWGRGCGPDPGHLCTFSLLCLKLCLLDGCACAVPALIIPRVPEDLFCKQSREAAMA